MTNRVQGVNLGGWLVLEKWLTASVFAGTDTHDEYMLSHHLEGPKRIESHRKTFITENDFRWLAEHDVNLVRIPVGYWLFEKIDGYSPTSAYLDKAMKWAAKYDIKVLIDLHAARGSQNGFDNSGRAGKSEWFTNADYREQTLQVLQQIAETYRDSPALWGIELLNEPVSKGHYLTLLRFYRRAYRLLCGIVRPGTFVVFHDSFRPWLFSGSLWVRKSHPVMMDVHWYVFSVSTKNMNDFLRRSSFLRKVFLRYLQLWQPVLVGEWSSVLPQPFFDKTPQPEHNELLKKNVTMQKLALQHAAGSVYWNYKAEGGGMWSYRDLVEMKTIDPSSV